MHQLDNQRASLHLHSEQRPLKPPLAKAHQRNDFRDYHSSTTTPPVYQMPGSKLCFFPGCASGIRKARFESRPTTTDDTEDCRHVILGQIGRVSSHDWLIHGFYYSLQLLGHRRQDEPGESGAGIPMGCVQLDFFLAPDPGAKCRICGGGDP